MTAMVKGVYNQGKIELLETPAGLPEGPVRVIVFAEEPRKAPPTYLTFGKYRTGKMSSLEDFQNAEWHGEEEFDDRHGK